MNHIFVSLLCGGLLSATTLACQGSGSKKSPTTPTDRPINPPAVDCQALLNSDHYRDLKAKIAPASQNWAHELTLALLWKTGDIEENQLQCQGS